MTPTPLELFLNECTEKERAATPTGWQYQANMLLGPSVEYNGNTGAADLGSVHSNDDLKFIVFSRNNINTLTESLRLAVEALNKYMDCHYNAKSDLSQDDLDVVVKEALSKIDSLVKARSGG